MKAQDEEVFNEMGPDKTLINKRAPGINYKRYG